MHPGKREVFCIMERTERYFRYKHSKKGVTGMIYSEQVKHSRMRGHHPPKYSLQEIREWCFSQQLFNDLYNAWVESGYDRWMKPSIDRIDNSKGYSFDNIQLTTWRGNYDNWLVLKCNGMSKKVLQYTKDGNFIREYDSASEAARSVNVSHSCITGACHGTYSQSRGYIWKFK